MRKITAQVVSPGTGFGHEQGVFALMLALPATLLGLVVLLVVAAQLERQLDTSVRPARLATRTRRVRVSSAQQR